MLKEDAHVKENASFLKFAERQLDPNGTWNQDNSFS